MLKALRITASIALPVILLLTFSPAVFAADPPITSIDVGVDSFGIQQSEFIIGHTIDITWSVSARGYAVEVGATLYLEEQHHEY